MSIVVNRPAVRAPASSLRAPTVLPVSSDRNQTIRPLPDFRSFVISGKALGSVGDISYLGIELPSERSFSVELSKGDTPLKTAKALKKTIELETRGAWSAQISRQPKGAVKFQVVQRAILPNE
jgi:hypothetical protein